MTKEKEVNGNVVRKFETMMPLDVYRDLTLFAKEVAGTGMGKFDYSVGIRHLLKWARFSERFEELEDRMEMLELELENTKNKPIKKESGVPTFGGNKYD